jgi:hypothetical protein
MNDKMALEITSDPSDNREIILEIIKQLRGPEGKPASREIAIAVTKLQEANFWLGEALFGDHA